MNPKADQAKAKILAAALAVLNREGARAVSLDKVAHQAGVSKGGLTHHFKSKNDLFLGLADLVIASLQAKLAACLADEPEGRVGRFTRAYLRVNLESIQSGEAQSMRGLIELVLVLPDLLAQRRQMWDQWQQQLDHDGLPPMQALTLAAASDGCWMNVLLGFYDAGDPRIELLHQRLIARSRRREAA
ncbi:MAG: TetR/AcrR family transcriptional regulator [Bryobacteraceae bacterium]|nr:TetR/AcrR family transcriptional regulator [Bryobacteraceae bacterium]